MAKISKYRCDPEKEQKGVWVEWEEDMELLIARMHNDAMQEYIRQQTIKQGNVRTLRRKNFTDEEMEDLTRQAIGRHVLLGWKNIQGDDGEDIPYSVEQAVEWMTNLEFDELRKFVIVTSSDTELYRLEALEDAKGNSPTASNGNSSSGQTSVSSKTASKKAKVVPSRTTKSRS